MSHTAIQWALKQRGLKPATKMVLLCLADHHNGQSSECFPSQETIAAEAEIAARSVRTHLAMLEERGLIERDVARRVGGEFAQTRYTLRLDRQLLPAADSADGRNGPDRRQDLPPNLGRESRKREEEDAHARRTVAQGERIIVSLPQQTDLDEALGAYNVAAARCGWRRAERLDASRRSRLGVTLAELGTEGWAAVIDRAAASTHLRSRRHPIDLGWFLDDAHITETVEGRHDDRSCPTLPGSRCRASRRSSAPRQHRASSLAAAAFAEERAERAVTLWGDDGGGEFALV